MQVKSYAKPEIIPSSYLYKYIQQRKFMNYSPIKRILALIATHTDCPLRLETIHTSLPFIQLITNYIVIINSSNQPYNDQLKQ